MNRDSRSTSDAEVDRGVDTAGAASELVCSDVLASWHHEEDHVPYAVRGIESDGRIGFWPEYGEEAVVASQRLPDTDHQRGRNSQYMRVELLDDSTTAERAFVVEHPANDARENALQRAHSRLATWAFVDSLGVSVPRHLWLADSEELIVEGVSTGEVEAQTVYGLSHPEWVSRISTTALLDQCAVQLLAGNRDLGQMNVCVDENGGVHLFDFDRAGIGLASPEAARAACSQAKDTAAVLGEIRGDDGALFSKSELLAHTRTLATRLQTEFSHELESALDVVRRYDAVFEAETSRQFAETFEQNVACLSGDQ